LSICLLKHRVASEKQYRKRAAFHPRLQKKILFESITFYYQTLFKLAARRKKINTKKVFSVLML